MSITKSIVTGVTIALIGTAAMAEGPKIYPYASKDNYCPNGLQPITISGVICCGTPTTDQSYQSTMAHPTSKKHYKKKYVHKARSADTCAEGTKGCY